MLPHGLAHKLPEGSDTKAVPDPSSPNLRITEEKCSVDLNCSEPNDTEAGYIHSVAPDPRRLDIVDNPRIKEEGCWSITEQKKYYALEDTNSVFIKRNLTPSEYDISLDGRLVIPYMCIERMKNEVAAIRYIQRHTTIPTPNIRAAFEDNGRYYIVTDIVPGVTLAQLPDDKKAPVIAVVEGYMAQMHALKSKVMGSFVGDVIVPHRIIKYAPKDLKFREADTPQFVLCHNDLSQHNILVDEATLKVNAIIDWEFAGFYPPEFDGKFYLRPGPSVALNGEGCDRAILVDLLKYWRA